MQSVMKCGHTLPVFGRVPREGLARLWRTTLLARSSELYLLRRSLRKGVLSPSGQQSFSQRKAERILRRHEQNLRGFWCRSCVRNEMQYTAPARKRYISSRPAAAITRLSSSACEDSFSQTTRVLSTPVFSLALWKDKSVSPFFPDCVSCHSDNCSDRS